MYLSRHKATCSFYNNYGLKSLSFFLIIHTLYIFYKKGLIFMNNDV